MQQLAISRCWPAGHALVASVCGVLSSGCAASDDSFPPEAQSARPVVVATREGTLILSTALVAPTETIRYAGSLTLEYVGPHEFPDLSQRDFELPRGPVADLTVEKDTFEDPYGFSIGTASFVDSQGHEWRVIDSDDEVVAAEALVYRDAHKHGDIALMDGGQTAGGDWDVFVDSGQGGQRATWSVYECSGGAEKWVYNPGTQSDLVSMNDTQRMPMLDANQGSATAVLVAPNLAFTAGHVASGAIPGNSFCRKNSNGSPACRDVEESFFADVAGNDDWGLILFSSAFPSPQYVYDLSVENDNTINNYTPRFAGYPTLRLGQEASCGGSSPLEGERNLGTFHGLLQKEARVDITCGGGMSGGPYYYFGNTNYEIFGVHSDRGSVLGNKYCYGPKVPFWIDDIIAAADALGVDL